MPGWNKILAGFVGRNPCERCRGQGCRSSTCVRSRSRAGRMIRLWHRVPPAVRGEPLSTDCPLEGSGVRQKWTSSSNQSLGAAWRGVALAWYYGGSKGVATGGCLSTPALTQRSLKGRPEPCVAMVATDVFLKWYPQRFSNWTPKKDKRAVKNDWNKNCMPFTVCSVTYNEIDNSCT